MNLFSRMAITGFLAAAVAGCATPAENGPEHAFVAEKSFPIRVEPQVATLVVQVDADGHGLLPGEADRIVSFAGEWKSRGHGALSVSAPSGTANASKAQSAIQAINKILSAQEISKSAIRASTYRGAANDTDAPITLSFVTDVAVGPECGTDWSQNMAAAPRNLPWSEFGCSTQSNIAAVLEDPRDLQRPRGSDKADAMRRTTVVQKYREGKSTATEVQADKDSGNVSEMKAE